MEQAIEALWRTTAKREKKGAHDHKRCARGIETVMHYVRMLNGVRSRVPRDADERFDASDDPSAGIAWRCAACDTMVPLSNEPPDACPICGSARQDLSGSQAL
jgi:rubrerythrin